MIAGNAKVVLEWVSEVDIVVAGEQAYMPVSAARP